MGEFKKGVKTWKGTAKKHNSLHKPRLAPHVPKQNKVDSKIAHHQLLS